MNTLTTLMGNAMFAQAQGDNSGFIIIILIFAIFYFVLIRPQQRKEKERKKKINELRAGAKIIFAGGLIGKITEVKESTFMVEVAQNTIIEIARGAVIRDIAEDETPTVEAN